MRYLPTTYKMGGEVTGNMLLCYTSCVCVLQQNSLGDIAEVHEEDNPAVLLRSDQRHSHSDSPGDRELPVSPHHTTLVLCTAMLYTLAYPCNLLCTKPFLCCILLHIPVISCVPNFSMLYTLVYPCPSIFHAYNLAYTYVVL